MNKDSTDLGGNKVNNELLVNFPTSSEASSLDKLLWAD